MRRKIIKKIKYLFVMLKLLKAYYWDLSCKAYICGECDCYINGECKKLPFKVYARELIKEYSLLVG